MIRSAFAVLALVASSPATAAVSIAFAGGSGAVAPGQSVVTDFDDNSGLMGSYLLYAGPNNGNAARPFFGQGSTQYLSVLGGQSATLRFAQALAVSFDLSSLDNYNTLTVLFKNGATQVLNGRGICNFLCADGGDQMSATTNGRLNLTAGANQSITGLTLASSTNSFEIDRVAILASPTPEPEAWASMAVGLGLAGWVARRRQRRAAHAA